MESDKSKLTLSPQISLTTTTASVNSLKMSPAKGQDGLNLIKCPLPVSKKATCSTATSPMHKNNKNVNNSVTLMSSTSKSLIAAGNSCNKRDSASNTANNHVNLSAISNNNNNKNKTVQIAPKASPAVVQIGFNSKDMMPSPAALLTIPPKSAPARIKVPLPAVDSSDPDDRKKRCADRYDSSESSDSGVATLSCTDSSTASSDTSDPGSPYSPPSLGDNDLQSPPNAISTPHSKPIPIAPKMPPLTSISQNPTLTTTNRCQQNQPHQWPWNSAQTVLSGANKGTATATATNNNNINNINNNKLKRPSTDKSDAAANNKKSRSTSTDKLGATGSKKAPTPLIVKNGKVPEKITGYFKTQTKSSTTLKKDISNVVMQSASIAAMPPLTEISPKPKGSESLKKYFSLLAQQAGEKPLKPEFDVRPVQTTLTTSPALITAPPRKPEKKTAKVSPMVSTAPKKSQKLPTISPKKPVTIAPRIAKPTAAAPPIAAKKLPTGMKQLPPPPTVVLTAIRMSPSQAPPPLQPASSTPMSPPKATPTQAKVGPVFSMMPNLVQIPNLVASTPTKAPGLVMNNGLAAARINAAAQLLMNGAVIKLQQMQNAETPISTASGPMPHQLKTFQQKPPQMSYTAPQLFMTNSGIYYNAPLPIYGGIPALQPIQQTLPSINTILPSHHQTAPPPVIPKPSVIPKPVAPITTTASIGSQTTSSYISKMMTPALLSEPPKLVPVSLKVNTALPAVSPAPVPAPAPTVIDLCSPTLPQLSPKAPKVPLSPTSPKSQVLERIRRGASPDLKVDLSISLESVPTPKKEAMLPPPLVPSLPERSKSPMLTEPKIIRFPAQQRNAMRMGVKGARRSDGRSDGACYWDGCNEKFENNSQLLDHLQTHHVNPQTGPFSCLWSGCKVQGKKSCSRTWLERHVLPHGGNRTYKCIVDGCGLRFPSQLALQKHVNKHFTTDKSKSDDKPEQPTAKLIKKNGKKFRYRRQPWSARRVDYFDQGKMEGLQHRLMLVGALASGPKGSICFKGRPMARRTGKMGTEILVKWFPTNIIADEWVSLPSDSKVPEKQMPIKSMSLQEQIELQKFLRHIYKVNRHKMNLDSDSASMSSEISSSSSLSTCSSLDAPAFQQHVISAEESSNSSNPSLHRHQSSFSRTSSMSFSFSSSTTSLSTLSSSLNQQQNGNNVDALSNIRRMTKKYRKPPRTMPS